MRLLIADLVTELSPVYDETKRLAKPFIYEGERQTDILLSVSEKTLDSMMSRAAEGVTVGKMENLALSSEFCRKAIPFGTMLIHSSALICDGGAYLFSADSGVGKSTHTRLWLREFGERVHIMNDDKPVVRLLEDGALVCGTPFDGGSGIALNETYPLKAVVFVERGEENSVRVPASKEIIQKLYFQTAHFVSAETAVEMLNNFEKLLGLTRFFVLTCNMDSSAAHVAYEEIVEKKYMMLLYGDRC